MKLTKLTNWFSDEEPDRNKPSKNMSNKQIESPANEQLAKTQLKIDQLNRDLQESQKELAQTKAQLQIHQGFQIELGETQLKLQQTQAELQRYKKDIFEQQKQLSAVKVQYEKAQQNIAQLSQGQNWINQLKKPIQIAKIEKTLPKQDFETLWGFGILSPTLETIITTGALFVRGWVLGRKSLAETIAVKYQNESLLTAPVKLRRPIVAQQYPDISAAANSGFEFSLSVAAIAEETELSLEAWLEDGTVVSLCNFVLKPQTIESNDT